MEVREREGIYIIWFNDDLSLRGQKTFDDYMFSVNTVLYKEQNM